MVPSSAQPAPKDDSKVDAQSLMQSGVKLLEGKDYLGALAVFKTAYERYQGAKILLNIGTTLKLLGREADAANAYQRYLDAKDTDPKRRPEIEKLIAKIDNTVGRYDITPTPSNAYGVRPGAIEVRFDDPQRPVAPGQTVALYDALDPDAVVGAGIAA